MAYAHMNDQRSATPVTKVCKLDNQSSSSSTVFNLTSMTDMHLPAFLPCRLPTNKVYMKNIHTRASIGKKPNVKSCRIFVNVDNLFKPLRFRQGTIIYVMILRGLVKRAEFSEEIWLFGIFIRGTKEVSICASRLQLCSPGTKALELELFIG